MLRRYEDAAKTLDGALAWKPLDFSLAFMRADVDMNWNADLRQWKDVIASEAARNTDANDLITARLGLALKERDYHGGEQTLAAHGGAEFDDNGFFTPREWNQAIVARGLGDKSRANAAFLAARERAAMAVREQPEDGKSLTVLAQRRRSHNVAVLVPSAETKEKALATRSSTTRASLARCDCRSYILMASINTKESYANNNCSSKKSSAGRS